MRSMRLHFYLPKKRALQILLGICKYAFVLCLLIFAIASLEGYFQTPKLIKNRDVVTEKLQRTTTKPSKRGQVWLRGSNGFPLVKDKIFWSEEAEALVPKGYTTQDWIKHLCKSSSDPVVYMSGGNQSLCGRPKNQFINLQNGQKMCVRYRDSSKFTYGDVLSFSFSKLLGFDNVPLLSLQQVNFTSRQWRGMNSTMKKILWSEGNFITLTEMVDIDYNNGRSWVKFANEACKVIESGQPLTYNITELGGLSNNSLVKLVQFSDLVIFDYIIGHQDRLIMNMKHEDFCTNKPTKNLFQNHKTGKLWFLDNESGFFDGYEHIYSRDKMNNEKVEKILKFTCIFRKQTVHKLLHVGNSSDPFGMVVQHARDYHSLEPLLASGYNLTYGQVYFKKRLNTMLSWINHCKTL